MLCFAAARSMIGIAAAITSGPIPSPPITAIWYVFTNRPTAHPPTRRSFKPRRSPARQTIRPADVELRVTARALQVSFLRLAAMRAEARVAFGRQDATAVLALVRAEVFGLGRRRAHDCRRNER